MEQTDGVEKRGGTSLAHQYCRHIEGKLQDRYRNKCRCLSRWHESDLIRIRLQSENLDFIVELATEDFYPTLTQRGAGMNLSTKNRKNKSNDEFLNANGKS